MLTSMHRFPLLAIAAPVAVLTCSGATFSGCAAAILAAILTMAITRVVENDANAVKLIKLTVQRLDGTSFEIVLRDTHRSVMNVKHEVSKVVGVPASLQDLFVLSGGHDDDGNGAIGVPLDGGTTVEDGWVLSLVMKGMCRNMSEQLK